jgi:hypothetical protein
MILVCSSRHQSALATAALMPPCFYEHLLLLTLMLLLPLARCC